MAGVQTGRLSRCGWVHQAAHQALEAALLHSAAVEGQQVGEVLALGHQLDGVVLVGLGRVLEPEDVAAITLAAIEEESFLILPHPEVLEYYRRKGSDYDRWLAGMRRLQRESAAE